MSRIDREAVVTFVLAMISIIVFALILAELGCSIRGVP